MKLSPVIVALDVADQRDVEKIVKKLGASVDFYKVGMKLFTRYGPDLLKYLRRRRKKIFLDLKFHDIPNTVAEACREGVRHRVQLMTLHASGGSEMMGAAAAAVREESRRLKIDRPYLFGVTVLTSMDAEGLSELGVKSDPAAQVLRLAQLSEAAGMDGVICSPQEIEMLRQKVSPKFKIITPGVRPKGSDANDQKRIATPQEAFTRGANAIVIGRPVLQAKDPQALLRSFF